MQNICICFLQVKDLESMYGAPPPKRQRLDNTELSTDERSDGDSTEYESDTDDSDAAVENTE